MRTFSHGSDRTEVVIMQRVVRDLAGEGLFLCLLAIKIASVVANHSVTSARRSYSQSLILSGFDRVNVQFRRSGAIYAAEDQQSSRH